MGILTADRVRTESGGTGAAVKVSEKIIPDSARAGKNVASWCRQGQPMKPCKAMTPKAVCIHNTDDLDHVEDDAEQYTRATWPNCNMGGVVVHYYVDELGAWQNLREYEQGWHAGDGYGPGNTQSVAIEIIMDGSGSEADLKAEDNGARLAAAILHRHGLGIDDLHSHYFYSTASPKKNCPLYIRPHWEQFAARVREYMEMLDGPPEPETEPEAGERAYRVQVGYYTVRENAVKQYQALVDAGFPAYIKEEGR